MSAFSENDFNQIDEEFRIYTFILIAMISTLIHLLIIIKIERRFALSAAQWKIDENWTNSSSCLFYWCLPNGHVRTKCLLSASIRNALVLSFLSIFYKIFIFCLVRRVFSPNKLCPAWMRFHFDEEVDCSAFLHLNKKNILSELSEF